MNVESIIMYCLEKEDAEESFPFGEHTLVFKIGGKIFLLLSLDAIPAQFNAKCNPEKALELREEYEAIIPGYHMNKKHWNTVILDGTLTDAMVKSLIDDSYGLVKPKTKGIAKK